MTWEWREDEGGSRWAYRAELARCRGCQVKESEEKRQEKAGVTGGGLYVKLAPEMKGKLWLPPQRT